MENTQLRQPHGLTLQDRKVLSLSGVREVISFDEQTVELATGLGLLTVHGQGLQLKNLTMGDVAVEGSIDAIIYRQTRQERGWLARLLR